MIVPMETPPAGTAPTPPALTSSSPAVASRRPGRSTVKWVLLLGALATLPAFTVDMYLPSLPEDRKSVCRERVSRLV